MKLKSKQVKTTRIQGAGLEEQTAMMQQLFDAFRTSQQAPGMQRIEIWLDRHPSEALSKAYVQHYKMLYDRQESLLVREGSHGHPFLLRFLPGPCPRC
jgi:hypothetical protein